MVLNRSALVGAGLALLAVSPPVDAFADEHLPAHMSQHLVLVALAAPLLALAPRTNPWPRLAGDVRTHGAVVAWIVSWIVLWVWHLPGPFDAAVRSDLLHATEHATLLLTAWLAWTAIVTVGGTRPLPSVIALAVVGLTALQGTALGAAIAFTARPWYPSYGTDHAALLDQQIAGALMAVLSMPVDLVALAVLAFALVRESDEAAAPEVATWA